MTEAEWFACSDPGAMLTFLGSRGSARKSRLFTVACCRSIWRLLVSTRSRAVVETAERFSDGQASRRELANARKASQRATEEAAIQLNSVSGGKTSPTADEQSAWSFYWACYTADLTAAAGSGYEACRRIEKAAWATRDCADADWLRKNPGWLEETPFQLTERYDAVNAGLCSEQMQQAAILREIVGNPFGLARPIDPGWPVWQDGMIPKLALAIYDDRAFDRLPILADALEEAGCTDSSLLDHLRGHGPHVRGCWALDQLSGKG